MKIFKKFEKSEIGSVKQKILRNILASAHRIVRGLGNRFLNKSLVQPRQFSNVILRHYAPAFTGDVINVSGWRDEDQAGFLYRSYFTAATSYVVSNSGEPVKGIGSHADEFEIDLSVPIAADLKNRYDVVFNHTTLEHVFEIKTAFKNLCEMSRDAIILVVPVLQQIHFSEGYGDYNRLTTMGIVKSFEENGFETIVLQTNEQEFAPIYCVAIAVRADSKYKHILEKNLDFAMGGELWGSKINTEHISKHVSI